MSTTELKDVADRTKKGIYEFWRKNISFENYIDTQLTVTQFGTVTSSSFNQERINVAARKWESIEENIAILTSKPTLLTTSVYKSDFSVLVSLLDKETLDFCNQRNILSEAESYYKLIYKVFQNTRDIKITLQPDYEIDNLKMVRFDVKIRDEIDNILRKEDKFYENIRKLISTDSMMNFVLTTQVV